MAIRLSLDAATRLIVNVLHKQQVPDDLSLIHI